MHGSRTFFTRDSNPSTLTILISFMNQAFTDRSMYMKILIKIGKFNCLLNFDFNNIIINNNIKKNKVVQLRIQNRSFLS
jgi:hypothetical protein